MLLLFIYISAIERKSLLFIGSQPLGFIDIQIYRLIIKKGYRCEKTIITCTTLKVSMLTITCTTLKVSMMTITCTTLKVIQIYRLIIKKGYRCEKTILIWNFCINTVHCCSLLLVYFLNCICGNKYRMSIWLTGRLEEILVLLCIFIIKQR
jgi:hypothetical protein